ncbi:MAG: M23 family metallopeptidase [Bacteroidales bacterium]|nr:M23 family metallopeptidase [Bacteroidales bacterium]MDD2425159.1 M23 family metallopeptidase [Bacteroidales bacterium]MDD3989594.1 M23 family metallopeptidase [Bacteroidales bacterium]MDD4639491.1 M23 family metallopeptidase [Bacteroidales bacterium]
MARVKKEKKKRNIRNRYRFAIFNDTSHEELFVFRANGLAMIVSICLALIFIIGAVTVLISYTPLREFIPGYPNAQTRRAIVQNAIKADSLERVVKLWDYHLVNIQRVITGQKPLENIEFVEEGDTSGTALKRTGAREDSILREEVTRQEQFSLGSKRKSIEQIEGLHFFQPVEGVVSQSFNLATNHPYIDIAAPKNSVVSAVLDGTVISAGWSDETGFTIQIQHSNDLISIYKHNSKLLKKTGDKVKAGSAIALVGDSGSLSTGSHLHFELWHKGVAIDPAKYIKF